MNFLSSLVHFGSGKVIKFAEVLETEEKEASKKAHTIQLLTAYKSKHGLNIDPQLKFE